MSSPRTRRVHHKLDSLEGKYHAQIIRVARENNVADFVEFFKEKFGEQDFTKFIWYLSTPIYSLRGYPFSESDYSPPSVLINIMKEFFDLLKNTPDLPQIVKPFIDIINIYGEPSHETFSSENYTRACNKIIDTFISDKQLDTTNVELATHIQLFFNNVVSILIDFIYERQLQKNPEARIAVGVRMESICLILGHLIHVITINKPYHKIIQGFTIEDLIAYGKAEREKDINELKKRNSKTYRLDEYQINQGLDELAEERQEERDERRQQRKYEGKEGGRRRLKTRSIKTIKRRAYKKCSYKK